VWATLVEALLVVVHLRQAVVDLTQELLHVLLVEVEVGVVVFLP
jgi:hypothetical protein